MDIYFSNHSEKEDSPTEAEFLRTDSFGAPFSIRIVAHCSKTRSIHLNSPTDTM
jgi:hypothetical protein